MDDFWSLGISYHGKEEIWFVKVPANGHSILKQLGHKPRTPHMRRGKNEFCIPKAQHLLHHAYHAQQYPEVLGKAQI